MMMLHWGFPHCSKNSINQRFLKPSQLQIMFAEKFRNINTKNTEVKLFTK